MSRGKRYDQKAKLNVKKVIAVLIAIAVFIMFIIGIKELISTSQNPEKITAVSYYSVYTNEKWGVIDSLGNIIIQPTYQEMIVVPNPQRDIFLCTEQVDYEKGTYKTKVINAKNKTIWEEYETVEAVQNIDKNQMTWYEEGILKVKKDGKYGLINEDGKEILAIEYDKITALTGVKNSYLIEKNEKYGICDKQGTIIIKPEYVQILGIQEDYTNGYIVKNTDGKYGLMDFNKAMILEERYEEIYPITGNNQYVVTENGQKKIITKEGETVASGKFDEIKAISKNGVIFIKNNKYGVLGVNGEEKIPAQYEEIRMLFDENYIVKNKGKYGIINENKEEKVGFNYDNITYYEKANMIELQKNTELQTTIMNQTFEEKLTGIITEINEEQSYLRVKEENDYQYYDFQFRIKKPQEVLTKNTLFLSKKDGKYGYTDKEGNLIVEYEYDDATEQNQYGFVAVKKDGKWGSLNKTGKEEISPEYSLTNNLIIDFIGKWHLAEDMNANYYTDQK